MLKRVRKTSKGYVAAVAEAPATAPLKNDRTFSSDTFHGEQKSKKD